MLAPLAALDLPLTLDGEADLGLDLIPSHMRLHVVAGTDAGTINVAGGAVR